MPTRSYHIRFEYFQIKNGFCAYKEGGFVTRAESEEGAWKNFWDTYYEWSEDYKPIRNERMVYEGGVGC